jgi:hypothetical protein
MAQTPAVLGRKAVVAILATIPPALLAAAVIFAAHTWSALSGPPGGAFVRLTPAPADANGSVAYNGTVTWRAAKGSKGTAIVADLTVPMEGTHIVLTFSKNTDQTLPVSHLIDVATSVLPGSAAGPVAKIGELVVAASPGDPGTPLIATVVDVSKGLFWIGLSPVPTDSAQNLRLLAAATTFRLPVTYASGTTATLTFAKGASGAAVFRSVMAAWGS